MRDNIKGGALTETTFLVLLATCQVRHGYAIMQFIEEQTKGRVTLGAGTLYGALNSLADKDWITLLHNDSKKKEYLITKSGRQILAKEINRLEEIVELANLIVKEMDYSDEKSI